MSYDLDSLQTVIHQQAITKKWKTEAGYCAKRAVDELIELVEAIKQNKSKKDITNEAIDVLYFVLQVAKDAAPNESLNEAFERVYNNNWNTKKKTEDENGNQVKR